MNITHLQSIQTLRFNRYIVECKCKDSFTVCLFREDLIDTQWNVNIVTFAFFELVFRFNRYIVECKFVHALHSRRNQQRFNRYIVECKWHRRQALASRQCRFNRYIVECKFVSAIVFCLLLCDLIDTQWNVNFFVTY